MDNRIRRAFDQVRAEDDLKQNTEAFLRKETHGFGGRNHRPGRLFLSLAAAGMAFVILASSYFYAIPAYAISLDADSSVELQVNRMERVISVKGINEKGQTLARSARVFFMKYTDALETIMGNDAVRGDLTKDQDISITVVGESMEKSEKMTDTISACAYAHLPNVSCMCGNREEAYAAREAGLPLGKYRAFLALKEYDPGITVEQISNMTMREIRERIERISGKSCLSGNGGMSCDGMNGTDAGDMGKGNHHADGR